MLRFLYQTLTTLGAPFIDAYLQKRMRRGREDVMRFSERLGMTTMPRPAGKLLWCHAASVGESVSLLALLDRLRLLWPQLHVLVTTGTVTSARLMAERLPHGVMHQYIPVDRLPYVRSFLDHWHPDAALWVESELWPNMLMEMRDRKIPAALVNGRMSEKSFRHWCWARSWIHDILATFSICFAQGEEERRRFCELGASNVQALGNLKYAAEPLPYDEKALQSLRQQIGARPFWLIASSHVGEEEMAAMVHRAVSVTHPNLLTIIVPRHAVRGDDIEQELMARGYTLARRSKAEAIIHATQIYLGDTMGELGLFYRLSPLVAIGGSFVPVGGHNPIEAAQLGATVILGPHTYNFTEITAEFLSHDAALQVADDTALEQILIKLLAHPEMVQNYSHAAQKFADEKKQVMDLVLNRLTPWLAPIVDASAEGVK